MKILYICHRFPFPPKRGGKIRPFNMIRHLAQTHEVHVCSMARSSQEAEEGLGIAGHCASMECVIVREPWQSLRMVMNLLTPTPSSMGYFYSRELHRRIRKLHFRNHYDLIFVHCSSVAQYVSDISDTPKILDFGDMDSQKWLKYSHYKPFPFNLGYRLEGRKLEREEARLARMFDMCTATTRAELATLREIAPGVATDWFPNGVDYDFFAPNNESYDSDLISFVGRMDYYPNQECMLRFCREVLPIIRQKRPDVRLKIVGADPSAEILQLGKLPGVTVTGTVPDVRPHVRQSALMVATLAIARGTQNKILESMAMGVPVVTTSLASEGVDAIAGEHLLVADSNESCADILLKLMSDPDLRFRYADAGRQRILSHHKWENSMKRLDSIILEAIRLFKNKSDKGR